MTDNHKFIAGLLLGAVAGAALTIFLKTDKGKEWLSGVIEEADNMQDELKVKLNDFDKSVTELLEKGRSFMEDLEQRAKASDS